MRIYLTGIFILLALTSSAQFHGPVGSANSIAMHTDSSAFIAWAKDCKVTRGYQDITNTNLGWASVGDSSYAIGKADAGIVSLGDGGSAIITVSVPITNGPGYDFAVFENAFNDSFLELAFVEVSSDGVNYVRFPATSNLPLSPQFDNNANMDASKINNLAGKYRALYGTPFDLQELSANTQIDINHITHIKIIDVVGNVIAPYASYDTNNNPINDPWPTPYPQGGFDLDAIGVIHQEAVGINENHQELSFTVYPNPVKEKLNIKLSDKANTIKITMTDVLGCELLQQELNSSQTEIECGHLKQGLYFVHVQTGNRHITKKIIKE